MLGIRVREDHTLLIIAYSNECYKNQIVPWFLRRSYQFNFFYPILGIINQILRNISLNFLFTARIRRSNLKTHLLFYLRWPWASPRLLLQKICLRPSQFGLRKNGGRKQKFWVNFASWSCSSSSFRLRNHILFDHEFIDILRARNCIICVSLVLILCKQIIFIFFYQQAIINRKREGILSLRQLILIEFVVAICLHLYARGNLICAASWVHFWYENLLILLTKSTVPRRRRVLVEREEGSRFGYLSVVIHIANL